MFTTIPKAIDPIIAMWCIVEYRRTLFRTLGSVLDWGNIKECYIFRLLHEDAVFCWFYRQYNQLSFDCCLRRAYFSCRYLCNYCTLYIFVYCIHFCKFECVSSVDSSVFLGKITIKYNLYQKGGYSSHGGELFFGLINYGKKTAIRLKRNALFQKGIKD